jgi:hypothetical protein
MRRVRDWPATPLVLLAITLLILIGDVVVELFEHHLTWSDLGVGASTGLSCGLVGAIVVRHKPRNPIGWLLLGVGAFFALNGLASDYVVLDYRQHHGTLPLGPLAILLQPAWAPGIVCFALSILLFPAGRVPGGAWRWALGAFLAVAALWLGGAFSIAINAIVTHTIRVDSTGNLLMFGNPTGGAAWWGIVQDVFFPALVVSAVAWLARQLFALRRAQGEQRAQLKWLICGVALSLAGGFASTFSSGTSFHAIGQILSVLLVAFPVSIGIALLRYRLYDIDRLVSRTLSYAVLTALLGGTFIGLIALSTDTFALSGRVGVAASTLVAAALFNPLRIRVQRIVDRRFNRAHYDAEATVAAFTACLRDAVEIDAIRADLLDAVNRAVQPTHASIWIKREVANR